MKRRAFLSDVGMGVTGMALGSLLFQDGIARADALRHVPPDGKAHFRPKVKSVIWLFMVGGASQVETFDPKPELNKHAGKTIAESPYKAVLDSPYLSENLREFVKGNHNIQPKIYPMQVGYRKWGKSGLEISDWYPNVAGCADELAIVRSMWTTDND